MAFISTELAQRLIGTKVTANQIPLWTEGNFSSVIWCADRNRVALQSQQPWRCAESSSCVSKSAQQAWSQSSSARTMRWSASRDWRNSIGRQHSDVCQRFHSSDCTRLSLHLKNYQSLRDEEFDVVHIHEPICPGPCQTALFLRSAPIVGTWHAAGGSKAYMTPGVRWLATRMNIRTAVSQDAKEMAYEALGGDYEVVFNGVEIDKFGTPKPLHPMAQQSHTLAGMSLAKVWKYC